MTPLFLAEVLATVVALGPGQWLATVCPLAQETGTVQENSLAPGTELAPDPLLAGSLQAAPLLPAQVFAGGVAPQAATVSGAALPEREPGVSPALIRGLDAIREDRFRADLEFFASDAMRGRNTPSPELQIAALYLKSRVEALGFQPGAENGWFQEYPVLSRRLDAGGTSLTIEFANETQALRLGEDYYFQVPSQAFDLDLRAGVVFAGAGSEEDVERLRAQGASLDGKWVLVLDRGKFLSRAIKRCKAAGAAGVIATPGPDYKRDSYAQKYKARSLDLFEPGKPQLTFKSRKTPPYPVVMLTREAASKVWQAASIAMTEDGYPEAGAAMEFGVHNTRQVVIDESLVKNLCAFWPGSDPELARETMILTAHYDHVGTREGKIYNGADDNASGTSGLLALADALVAYGPMQRSVLLLWVSGEEKGLWGSKVWVEDPWLPSNAQAVLNVNIDMIGRANPKDLYITPTMDHPSFNKVARAAYDLAGQEGFGELIGQDEFWSASDHKNFDVTLGLPVIFLSAGDHDDYHKPTDTADKIDGDKSARIVRVVLRILDHLQGAPLADDK